jgi:hypothetical protein
MPGLRSKGETTARGVRIGLIAACCLAALAGLSGEPKARVSGPALRLALLRAVAGDPDEARRPSHVGTAAPSTLTFPRGADVAARVARAPSPPAFGQATIAGVGGWGFEADLRLDPSNPSRLYMSSPDSGGSDTSWIWRSLDGGKTFKWVPAAAPLNGKVTACPGGGDTELAVDANRRAVFNDLSPPIS